MITEIAPAPERVASDPARPKGGRRPWDEVPRWQIYLPLSIYLLFTLIPFYWILLFALRPSGSTSLVPWPVTFDHFEKVWTERGFGTYFQNSVLVGVATLVMTTVVALGTVTACQFMPILLAPNTAIPVIMPNQIDWSLPQRAPDGWLNCFLRSVDLNEQSGRDEVSHAFGFNSDDRIRKARGLQSL